MSESFEKYFGKELEAIVGKAFEENLSAIHFLQNSQALKKYLSLEMPPREENEIHHLRSNIAWFDCSILKLQRMSFLQDYDQNTQDKAEYYLKLYCPDFTKNSKSIMEYLENSLIQTFRDIYKHGIAPALPIPACSQTYKMGTPYQEFLLTIPIPEESNSNIRKNLQFKFRISFHYLTGKAFTSDRFWGKMELVTPPEKEHYFSMEQKKQFFSSMYIDLKHQTPDEIKDLLLNLKCNPFGEFTIPSNQNDIQKALDENTLVCFLKLVF